MENDKLFLWVSAPKFGKIATLPIDELEYRLPFVADVMNSEKKADMWKIELVYEWREVKRDEILEFFKKKVKNAEIIYLQYNYDYGIFEEGNAAFTNDTERKVIKGDYWCDYEEACDLGDDVEDWFICHLMNFSQEENFTKNDMENLFEKFREIENCENVFTVEDFREKTADIEDETGGCYYLYMNEIVRE